MRYALVAFALVIAAACFAQDAGAGLVNGSFDGDEDGNGVADGWHYSAGGPADQLDVALSLDEGREGGLSQKIECTRFDGGHAMLAQIGSVAVAQGTWYEVSLWARGAVNGAVSIAVRDTKDWQDCGLSRRRSRAPKRSAWRCSAGSATRSSAVSAG